jgi:hypothetical protein
MHSNQIVYIGTYFGLVKSGALFSDFFSFMDILLYCARLYRSLYFAMLSFTYVETWNALTLCVFLRTLNGETEFQ